MAETASDVLVDRLIEWGANTVFGLPGDGINGFMEALRKRHDRIRYVHVRHEEVGALAAAGYAKFTGRLGVCFSTRRQELNDANHSASLTAEHVGWAARRS